jgi:enoyl-CoA hydratase/carnithine racemase
VMSNEEHTNVEIPDDTTAARPTIDNSETKTKTANENDKKEDGVVLLERAAPVAILTLSRPAALNALTWSMYQQIEEHLETLANDDAIRAIILRGDGGKAFAAGTDIQQFVGFTGEMGVDYEKKMEAIIERLYTYPKPTIAVVQGYAVGAGIILPAVCDLRYATPASRFGVPIGRTLGNCLSLKNYQHLVNGFGAMHAKEMLFTGRLLSAADALQCGFLTGILDEAQIMQHAQDIAQQISMIAPLTIWGAKEAHRRMAEAAQAIPFDDVIDRVYGSADFAEGVQAYLDKRKPTWQGK